MASGPDQVGIVDIARRLLGLLVLLGVLGWLGYHAWQRLLYPNEQPTRARIDDPSYFKPGFIERCGAEAELVVTIVHSPEKTEWIEHAANTYMARCINTQILLIARDDRRAIDELIAGDLRPTAWAPSDSMFVTALEQHLSGPALERGGPLIHTPLVLVTASDREPVLDELWPELIDDPRWLMQLACAGVPRESWAEPEPGEPATWDELWTEAFDLRNVDAELLGWGRVDYVHTVPTRDTVGLLALALIVDGYLRDAEPRLSSLDPAVQLEAAIDFHEPEIVSWLRRCEGAKPDFDGSLRTLTERVVRRDEPDFDGIVTYEHLALATLAQHNTSEPDDVEVSVLYPSTTFVSDHPIAFMVGDDGPGRAARNFVEFMTSPEIQHDAVTRGFRPGDLDTDLRVLRLEHNPFLEHREFGVPLVLPPSESPQLGAYGIEELSVLWSDATGRF